MARHKAHRDRADSPQRKVAVLAMMREGVNPPEGCSLSNAQEAALWGIYIQARVPDDWRGVDLLALYKVVKLESQIQEQLRQLALEGYLIEGKHGRPINNPRLRAVHSLQSMQIQLMRLLKITSIPDSQSAMASRARQANVLSLAADQVGDDLLSGRLSAAFTV